VRTQDECYDDDMTYPVVLVTSRVSRKERKCAVCYGEIKPGQRYERVFLPPDAEHDKSFTMVQHVGGGACVFGRL